MSDKLETKLRCPDCGHEFHRRPYLMATSPTGEKVWTPGLRAAALWILLFLFLVGVIAVLSPHL